MEAPHEISKTMQTLLLCGDEQFLLALRPVLQELNVQPDAAGSKDAALEFVRNCAYDVIILDWAQECSPYEVLDAIDRSEAHCDSVLVGIVSSPAEMKQAFAAGVHFLIHKPALAVQVERCLRVAYCSSVARRRKRHREPVNIVASVTTHTQPLAEAMLLNLSESGAGLRLQAGYESVGAYVGAGEEIKLRFTLPDTEILLQATGQVVWASSTHCGIRFTSIVDAEQLLLERWMTACVERSRENLGTSARAACA